MSGSPKVLVVLTSHGKLGDTGKPTGWYLVRPPLTTPLPLLPYHIPTNTPLLKVRTSPPSRPPHLARLRRDPGLPLGRPGPAGPVLHRGRLGRRRLAGLPQGAEQPVGVDGAARVLPRPRR